MFGSSSSFSKNIAVRYLRTKKSEAFITIISVIAIVGVAIGVMVLNIVMAVMTGFQHELREKIIGADSHVVVRQLSGFLEGPEELSKKIKNITGIESASPILDQQALIRTEGHASGVLIRGVQENTASSEQLQSFLNQKDSIQNLFHPEPVVLEEENSGANLPGIIIGRELARSLGISRGSLVSLLSSSVSSTPFGLVPRYRRFQVVGIYKSGLVAYESGIAYVALPEAQRFFRRKGLASSIEVRLKDYEQAPDIAKKIVDDLGGFEKGIFARDWTSLNKPLWDALRLEKTVYFIVLLLIIVMASFSIVSTLILIVLEKRKDIAVLRTLGATRKKIGRIFWYQGGIIGAVGTLLGLVLGYAGAVALREYGFPLDEKIFPVSEVPVRIEAMNFFIVGIASFLICLFSSVYPVRRAMKVDPSEALRYE